MNTTTFNTQHDRFTLLDMTAQFDFKTPGSISFLVGSGPSHYFSVRGRVEAHHPCVSEFGSSPKFVARVYLPADYLNEQNMQQVVTTLYSVLGVPSDEAHQVRFLAVGPKAYIVQGNEVVWCSPAL